MLDNKLGITNEVELAKDEKISMYDLVFVNDSKLGGTVFIDGLISYYYSAVYNRPNR